MEILHSPCGQCKTYCNTSVSSRFLFALVINPESKESRINVPIIFYIIYITMDYVETSKINCIANETAGFCLGCGSVGGVGPDENVKTTKVNKLYLQVYAFLKTYLL